MSAQTATGDAHVHDQIHSINASAGRVIGTCERAP